MRGGAGGPAKARAWPGTHPLCRTSPHPPCPPAPAPSEQETRKALAQLSKAAKAGYLALEQVVGPLLASASKRQVRGGATERAGCWLGSAGLAAPCPWSYCRA